MQRGARALFGEAFEAVLAVPGYLTAGDATGSRNGLPRPRGDRPGTACAGAMLTPEIIAALIGVALLALIATPIRSGFAPAEPPQ